MSVTEAMESRTQRYGKRVIAVLIWALLLWYAQRTFVATWRGYDFTLNFWNAGHMVLQGQRHNLYNLAEQWRFQRDLTGSRGVVFCYPSPVAVLYAPTAFFSAATGHLLWNIFSVLLFCACAYFLNRALQLQRDWFADFGLLCVCIPFYFHLVQGQIDAVLLLSFILGLWAMKRDDDVLTGVFLSLGLIKFQVMLPFLFILLLRKKWKTVGVSAIGGMVQLALMMMVSGVHSLVEYVDLLRHLNTIPDAIVHPAMMANFRGLYFVIAHREANGVVLGLFSLALLVWAARTWRDLESGYCGAMVVCFLVSYHAYPHSLILTVPALAVLAKRVAVVGWSSAEGLVLLLAGTPPLLIVTLFMSKVALMAIPVAAIPLVLAYSRNREPVEESPALRARAAS